MKYFVRVENGPVYEFTLEEVRENYHSGKFSGTWPARAENESEWRDVFSILEIQNAGSPTPAANSEGVEAPDSYKAVKRYADAYLVAHTVNGFGSLIKWIGIALAAIIMVPSLLVLQQREFMPFGVVGIAVGAFAGVLLYLLGIIVSAQGQILMASLDGAVNSSPFLSDSQKRRVMSL